jgi:hypothetical protein
MANPADPFAIDYWKVAAALCRGVHALRQDHGDDVAESAINLLTIELERVYPNLAWANVMTDDWPLDDDVRTG